MSKCSFCEKKKKIAINKLRLNVHWFAMKLLSFVKFSLTIRQICRMVDLFIAKLQRINTNNKVAPRKSNALEDQGDPQRDPILLLFTFFLKSECIGGRRPRPTGLAPRDGNSWIHQHHVTKQKQKRCQTMLLFNWVLYPGFLIYVVFHVQTYKLLYLIHIETMFMAQETFLFLSDVVIFTHRWIYINSSLGSKSVTRFSVNCRYACKNTQQWFRQFQCDHNHVFTIYD